MKAADSLMTTHKRKRPSSVAVYPSPQTEPLVPIRLDLTLDNQHRLQDTFVWPLNDPQMTPHDFATQLAVDLNLSEAARDDIVHAMSEQIAVYLPPAPIPADDENRRECRHTVRLDLRIGRIVIRDQFEWDLAEPQNSPEAFAELLCKDLGLGTEHVAAVAHALREQLVELFEFRDKRPRCEVVSEGHVVRRLREVGRWEPAVECLTTEEQERLERKEKREARLLRRNRGKVERGGKSRGRRTGESLSRRRSMSMSTG